MITTVQTEKSSLKADYNLPYVWLISVVAAMGGLLFGWDWVVIGGAKPFFQRYFELTNDAQIGWANSCALVGCLIGALIAGILSDKFGRKRLLIVAALLFAITSLGNALAGSFDVFIAWRICGGVAIGLASNLSPMYIAEIAPAQIRGKLVAINQLTVVVGILLAQLLIGISFAGCRWAQRTNSSAIPGSASKAGAGCSVSRPFRRCSFSSAC